MVLAFLHYILKILETFLGQGMGGQGDFPLYILKKEVKKFYFHKIQNILGAFFPLYILKNN